MKTIVTGAFCAALLMAGLAVLLWAARGSRDRYDEYIEPLDEQEWKVKKFLPVGLFLNEHVQAEKGFPKKLTALLMKYDGTVRGKIAELYDRRYLEYYMTVHRGSRWVMGLLGWMVAGVFGGVFLLKGELRNAALCVALMPAAAAGLPLLLDFDLNSRIEERHMQMQMEFPEFVNKLLLLVNAGMTIPKAWEKIVADNHKRTPLYMELEICMAEIRTGVAEAAAYEAFARRCKIKEIIKFVSIIILNLRKGGSEIVPTLRAQADESWDMRKAAAKRLGEKASSKLLLPMTMMLLGIIMIVALPAVLSLMNMGM